MLQRYVDEGRAAGMQALVARHGRVACFTSAGFQNIKSKTPITDDTIFRIFSMTKPITSIALMSLLEQGKCHLDDAAARWIPALDSLKVYTQEGAYEDLSAPITIRQLLTHTAGFSYGFDPDNCAVDALYANLWKASSTQKNLTDLLDEIFELPLIAQPGTRWQYSVATDVCARLVELMSDMPFGDYLRETIFDPLAMHDTAFEVPREKRHRLATLYGWTQDDPLAELEIARRSVFIPPVPEERAVLQSGGAGLLSTSADYLRFAQMVLNGGTLDGARIVSRKTVEWMIRNHVPQNMLPLAFNGIVPEQNSAYGFGLGFCVNTDAARAGTLGSTGDFGWGGLADTYCWVDPKESLIGILMQQYVPSLWHPGRRDFRNAVYQSLL